MSLGNCNLYVCRLTKREKADLDYKKNILKLAKEHEKAGEIEKVDRYYMPKDDVVRFYACGLI